MEEVFNGELEAGNPKKQLLGLLKVLASFYSFRELEKKLDIPMQTLWKYHSLRVVPEKETAVKVLKKIRESGILEEIMEKLAKETENPAVLAGNIGVYELIAFTILDQVEEFKVAKIFAAPDNYSTAIATLVAADSRVKLCLTDQYYAPQDSVCHSLVLYNRPLTLCYPRDCFNKKPTSIFVGLKYTPGVVHELYKFFTKHKQRVVGFYFLYGDREQARREVEVLEGERPIIRIFFRSGSAAQQFK